MGDTVANTDPIHWTQQRKRLGDLSPWPRNPRRIKLPQAKRLLESVQEFGQVETLAVGPDGDVYNGHQRLNVLMDKYGPDYEVDVRVSSRPLTEKEREKLTVYLHRGATGEWNFDTLANEFEVDELIEWGFEAGELGLDLTGGDGNDAEPQIDRAEELRQQWGVELGQLWRLPSRTPGQEHRLICGDCNDPATVSRINPTECQTLIFDPPWDIGAVASTGYPSVLVFGDGSTVGDIVTQFGPPTWVFVWDCVSSWYTPNRPLRRMKLCAWYGDIQQYDFDGWHYGDAGEARTVWNTRGGYEFNPDPRGKHLSDVFNHPITRLHAESEHNHAKPTDWVTLLIANCTRGGVYDPYHGFGTTLIAAEKLSRQCRAVEISPGYVAVALQRYADTFGIEPQLMP